MNDELTNGRKFIRFVENLSESTRKIIWMIADILSFIMGALYATLILFEIIRPSVIVIVSWVLIGYLFFLMLSRWGNIRGQINRYLNINDLFRLSFIALYSSVASALVLALIKGWFSWRFTIIATVTTAICIIIPRVLWQAVYNAHPKRQITQDQKRQVAVLGAGDGGSYFMESYRRFPGDIEVIAILDSDVTKHKKVIGGVPVIGDRSQLPQLLNEGLSEVIIAIPSLEGPAYEELLSYCNGLGLKVNKMPKIEEMIQGITPLDRALPKVEIADLLGRKEIKLDETLLRQELENKVILVTGAGGSIGSEIVRQVSRFNPRRILLLGHGENSIYQIYHEMLKKQRMIEYVPIIADIQDRERITQILRDEQPDVLYHAAAHKHVPLMEMNPIEAYKNNIIGTYNVAKAVDETGVKKMVMISSDKAVNPPNVMGASKRVAELIITGIAKESQSVFCAVRFGNVLGSRGSVIPLFEKQIAEGGPVTVTDFRMTRYFMTIPEASRLVIHAGAFAQSGEVFILDMGEPVKIIDLAKKMILLSGYNLHDIEIVESGIRPGEKLFEELLLSSERGDRQVNEKIFVGNVATRSLESIQEFIQKLQKDNPNELKEAIIAFANLHEEEPEVNVSED